MLTQEARTALVQCIHQNPQLRGSMIGLYDENLSVMLHTGIRDAPAFRMYTVIIEVSQSSNATAFSENDQFVEVNPQNANSGRAWEELNQAGISCALMVASGAGIVGASAAAPATGGASILLAVAAWGGFVTQSFQCGTGLYRTYMASTGQLQELQNIENDPFYEAVLNGINYANVAFGAVSLAGSVSTVARSFTRLENLLANRLPTNFTSLSRNAQRVSTAAALRRVHDTPGGPQLIREALRGAGFTSARIEQNIARIARSTTILSGGRRVSLSIQGVASSILAREAEPLANAMRLALRNLRNEAFAFAAGIAQSATAPDKIVTINIVETQN